MKQSRRWRKTALWFCAFTFLAGRIFAAELVVHAAASLTDALQEIAAAYQAESGDRVHLNLGASSLLARQIEKGAPGDVFLSADEAQMDALEKKSLLTAGTRRSLLSNTLVIVVPLHTQTQPENAVDLTKPAFQKLALAETQTVPAGIYAREYLKQRGLWEKLKDRVIPNENVRAALAAVESGNVDAAIVYKTDALLSKRAKIAAEIPAAEAPGISYPLAVLRSSREPERARKFANYLTSATAKEIFVKFGFLPAN